MRVHESQAYRNMDVTRERISCILELREVLLSIQIGFSLVNAAVACAILRLELLCRSHLSPIKPDDPPMSLFKASHVLDQDFCELNVGHEYLYNKRSSKWTVEYE